MCPEWRRIFDLQWVKDPCLMGKVKSLFRQLFTENVICYTSYHIFTVFMVLDYQDRVLASSRKLIVMAVSIILATRQHAGQATDGYP